MTIDDSSNLTATKEIVFLNIGKNVLAFQQLEHLLKRLLALANVRAVLEDGGAGQASLPEVRDGRSLGIVAGELFREVVVSHGAASAKVARQSDEDKIVLSARFQVETDTASHLSLKAALQSVVDERNALVHGFLLKWDWKSVQSMKAAAAHLIAQREHAEKQLALFKSIHAAHQAALSDLKEFIDSDAGAKYFES